MEDLSDLADNRSGKNLIDRVVEVFSPQAALKRQAARIMLRQYAAAKTTRLTGGWTPVDSDSIDIISSSLPMVRARVRQLVRDFPYFARALNILVDLTVGSGFNFQARVKGPGGQGFNKNLNRLLEDAFKRWSEEADVAKKLSFNELTRLSERGETETGESFFVRRKVKGRFLPLAIQAVEPDRLATQGKDIVGNNGFSDGIEYDVFTGEAIAYHFEENSYKYDVKRIPAEFVIHTYDMLRPGQMRGISPFTCAVICADDISNYIDSTLDTAKLASKYLAFVHTGDIGSIQVPRVTDTDDDGNKLEDMENAIIEYLQPNEKIEIADHKIPNNTFDPFTRFILRMTAVGTGVSYELLTGDYSGLSYSNLRSIRSDLKSVLEPKVTRRTTHFCNPVYRWFLNDLALSGRVQLPDYFSKQWEYEQSQWYWKGLESPDPLKDSKAQINMKQEKLASPQELIIARGRDPEDVLDEIEAWDKMLKERGIEDDEEVSTSGSNNPAALGA